HRFFFPQRRDQPRHHVRPQNAEGMGLKCDCNCFTAVCARAPYDLMQHLLVAAMNTVKVANADDSRSKTGWHFVQRAEDSHAISNSSFRPSCARRTCSGRLRLVSACGRSWEMCVKKARRGFSSSTRLSEFATVECVGCGRWRKASRNKISR